jgi:uncharacterized repeat protein (TIGR01451 family)
MKRTLVALSALLAITVSAFQPSAKAPLPNFDRRTDGVAAAAIAPEHAAAVEQLKRRIPQLEVTASKVLKSPDFFSSRAGFLTGPDAEGLGVLPATAQGIPKGDPHRAINAFLNEHSALLGYGAEALNGARISREYVGAHNGLRTVIWQQELNGIPVFEAITMGHITRNGELVNLYTHFVPDANGAATTGMKGRGAVAAANAPGLSAAQAIVLGARNVGDEIVASSLVSDGPAQGQNSKQTFRASGGLKGDQYAELVWVPLNASALRLCWQVIVTSASRSEMFLLIVDAETGEVMVRRCLTNYITNSTYNVWISDSPSPFSPGYQNPGNPAQPAIVARTLVTLPALNTNASPNGWIDDLGNETLGNNVDAHTDLEDDDQADTPRPQGTPFHTFDFPVNLATQDPTNYSPAAVVNLFYWNNFMHDKLWELGFTEAAGNFQSNNFGRGGLGGDAVRADAQDGAAFKDIFHVDNANMSTPPDGFPPRMQMYIFAGPDPDRDGDFDAEVMLHEYAHGLSNRRVGGGIGIFRLQSAGMGEGWSDFYGLSLLSEPADAIDGNWAAGGYLTFDLAGFNFRDNYYFGIRRYPYSTNLLKNPLTFKDIDPAQASTHPGVPVSPLFGNVPGDEVHAQGEVWCVTLWEVRANLIAKYGTNGNQIALQLVTDAMALCPPNPNFLQSRDAILLADRVNNNNANYAELWRAFAKRGMGSSATSPDSSTTRGVVESFDFPGLSIVGTAINDTAVGNGNGAIDVNECVELSISLRNNSLTDARSINAVLSTTTPGVTVVQASSTYADLAPNAIGQNQTPFRIYTSPSFICGTPVRLSLVTTSITTTQQVATNTFVLRSGFVSLNGTVLNNNVPLNIPDANTNGVSSTINVSGFSGAVGKVTVSLHLTHTFDADLVIKLIAPDGTTAVLSQNEGGAGDNFGISCSPFSARTTFDDNAQTSIGLGNPPFVGSFRPDEPLDLFVGKSGAALNGNWRLQVIDDFAIDVGTLQCWTLSLFPTVCTDGGGPCAADVAISATGSPAPAFTGVDLTYNVTITNIRPVVAGGVVISNVLPANATFVSATSSQGSCSLNGGTVVCTLGSLGANSGATATIVVRPTAVGSLTNTFTVGSSSTDGNPANNVATVVSTVVEPAPAFTVAGAQLSAESFSPATGGIESGETVTLNLTLRNTGSAASANLVATLQEGNGVSAASGPQTYGAIAPSALGTAPFTFTAPGAPGSSIDAVLQLQDGIRNLGTVTFHFVVGGEMTFESTAPITIHPLGSASPYPAAINVSGVAGVISSVRATFTKLTHTYPDDIDALLAGPRGQKVILMSDAGGANSINNRTITFDGSASAQLPNESSIVAGNYLPSNYDSGTEPSGDFFPAPAPVGSLSSSLQAFNSTDPNGTWSLFINDDGGGDGGVISGGWALAINTVVPINSMANLAVSASASPNPAIVGETLSYTVTVQNLGPSNAASVVLSDTIPANGSFVSASGNASFAAGVVTVNLGTINSGASANVTINVTPTSAGLTTNQATVSAGGADLDLSNNTVTTVVNASSPVADLALLVTSAPQTIFVSSNLTFLATVTNRGPNRAFAVQLSSVLSPLLAFVAATNSQGTSVNSADTVISNLGDLAANGSATVIITATAVNAGSASNLFALASPTSDPAPANNSTNVGLVINPLAPLIVASGSALASENPPPANGSLDSGETVTLSFGLRNVGTADTADLVATLLSSGGVSSPSAAQSYGTLVANGPTVSRPFSFVVSGASGSTLTATLQLQDGAQNLGTVTFAFAVSTSRSFTNNNVIIINSQGAATIYPSTTVVSGLAGSISKVTAKIGQLTHSFPEDIDMLLVGPSGQKVLLMSDAGAGNAINTGVSLTFDDSAAALPFANSIASGTYHPTDYPPGDTFAAPAPPGPYGTNLSAFNGTNPNGTWSLYAFDDAAGDAGRIDGGWTLNVQLGSPVAGAADVGVAVTAPATAESGEPFSYVVTVANHGPAAATGVVLTDTLPGNFTLGNVTVSQGSFSTAPGSVTANLGTLNVGASATITISGAGTGPAVLTNRLSVTATQTDPNLANNAASPVTAIGAPVLSIRLSGTDAVITWLAAAGYSLESSANVAGGFASAGLTVTTINGTNQVTVPAVSTKFYRLRKP